MENNIIQWIYEYPWPAFILFQRHSSIMGNNSFKQLFGNNEDDNLQISSLIQREEFEPLSKLIQQAEKSKINSFPVTNHKQDCLQWLLYESNNALICLSQPVNTFIQAVEQAKTLQTSIIDLLPNHYIFWKNIDSVYLGCNKALADAMGLPSTHAIIGKTDFDLPTTREQSELYRASDKEVMSTGEPKLNIEETQTLSGQGSRTLLTSKVPLLNNHGITTGVLAIYSDITEQKVLQHSLEKAKEEVEAANYIMTELIANLGHDLATPISDLGSITQMLSIYADEYPELKEFIEELAQRCEDCVNIRQKFIDATSISKLEVKLERFPIAVELLKLEKEFRALIDSKALKFNICPLKPFKEVFIETDRKKFSAILRELISNAIQFTPNAGEISISLLKSDGYFRIEITDTGIGIPSDKFEFIFKQYTKLSRSNKYGGAFKGVGAGLYLVTILVNLLGGAISVKSKVDKGSTFIFSIPERFSKM